MSRNAVMISQNLPTFYFQDVNANSPHSQPYSFFYGISSGYLMLIKTISRVDDIPTSHNLLEILLIYRKEKCILSQSRE